MSIFKKALKAINNGLDDILEKQELNNIQKKKEYKAQLKENKLLRAKYSKNAIAQLQRELKSVQDTSKRLMYLGSLENPTEAEYKELEEMLDK